jgi:hypothetical protein
MNPNHFPPNQDPENCTMCRLELKEVEESREFQQYKRTLLETIEKVKHQDQDDHVLTYLESTGGQSS